MPALRRLPMIAPIVVAIVVGAWLGGTERAALAGGDSPRLAQARVHYEQAVAHYNLDEFAAALGEFREAYRLKPDPSFLFNIAQCHRKLGETDAALDFLRKYLRSLPDAPNRADVERMIDDLRAQKASAPVVPVPAPAPTPTPEASPPAPVPTVVPPPPPPAPAAVVIAAPAPAPEASPPVYRRWWFWTALGAVVAGGVVAIVVATHPAPQPYEGSLDPHTIEVK